MDNDTETTTAVLTLTHVSIAQSWQAPSQVATLLDIPISSTVEWPASPATKWAQHHSPNQYRQAVYDNSTAMAQGCSNPVLSAATPHRPLAARGGQRWVKQRDVLPGKFATFLSPVTSTSTLHIATKHGAWQPCMPPECRLCSSHFPLPCQHQMGHTECERCDEWAVS